jgi:cell division cycle 2-like protein
MDLDLKEATNSSSSYDSKDEMTIQPFSQSELKHMLYQILSATQHLHERWYLHRDMKTSNILVNKKTGKVALCDFGLARKYQIPLKALARMVITLWYRTPGLLFGETVYGPEVDMWSKEKGNVSGMWRIELD